MHMQHRHAHLHLVPGPFALTVTDEPDADFLKYLHRRQGPYGTPEALPPVLPSAEAQRLDISLDDPEGDVVAGVAAWTAGATLYIDLLWVEASLRGQGIGRQLIAQVEQRAWSRGCLRAAITCAPVHGAAFYQKLGYSLTARLMEFPTGTVFAQLAKTLAQPVSEPLTRLFGRSG